MLIPASLPNNFIKNMQIATIETPHGTQNDSIDLETNPYSSKYCAHEGAETGNLGSSEPSR